MLGFSGRPGNGAERELRGGKANAPGNAFAYGLWTNYKVPALACELSKASAGRLCTTCDVGCAI